jgi:hypothetical protein
LLLFSSLKSLSLDSHCPMFSFISKSQCSDLHCPMFSLISTITQQQQQCHSCSILTSRPQPANQNPSSKNLASSFCESVLSSGKQGGGAAVLGEGEGCDETPAFLLLSLNLT